MTNPIRFDWVISLGQVLTLITLITAAVFAYANLDRSVTEHERRIGAIAASFRLTMRRADRPSRYCRRGGDIRR